MKSNYCHKGLWPLGIKASTIESRPGCYSLIPVPKPE